MQRLPLISSHLSRPGACENARQEGESRVMDETQEIAELKPESPEVPLDIQIFTRSSAFYRTGIPFS
jgi:hypothetical protein